MRTLTRREHYFGIIFALALVWGGWNYRHLFTTSQPAAPSASPVVASPQPVSIATRAAVYTEAEWGTDPFNRDWRFARTAAAQPSAVVRKSALKLSAIVVRPQKRYAIINGLIVREGDMIAGRRVTRIESARVLLDDHGVEVTLTL